MKVCFSCGKQVSVDRNLSRSSACPHCDADMRVCLNCRFHAVNSHNQCAEPKAEFQRNRDRATYCDYFQFKESSGGSAGSGGNDDAAEARRKLDDLFG